MRTKPRIGSPRLRLGQLKSRSGLDRRKDPRRSPSRDGSTRRKGLRFGSDRAPRDSALAPGARATPDGERRDPQTAQQPTTDASARREDGPGSTPLRRSPPKAERRCDRDPPGVIASESGLTARLPRGTGPSVAQERRFNLRTRVEPSADFRCLLGPGIDEQRARLQPALCIDISNSNPRVS